MFTAGNPREEKEKKNHSQLNPRSTLPIMPYNWPIDSISNGDRPTSLNATSSFGVRASRLRFPIDPEWEYVVYAIKLIDKQEIDKYEGRAQAIDQFKIESKHLYTYET